MRVANGVAMIDSSELDDQTAAAIATVAQTRDGIKIKFHDKRAALMDIGRHLGPGAISTASQQSTYRTTRADEMPQPSATMLNSCRKRGSDGMVICKSLPMGFRRPYLR
jgi:hypothetical protein